MNNNKQTLEQTPEQTAKQLIDEFKKLYNYTSMASPLSDVTAQNCAIITVNKVLETLKILPMGMQYLSERDYWEEVKTLIVLK